MYEKATSLNVTELFLSNSKILFFFLNLEWTWVNLACGKFCWLWYSVFHSVVLYLYVPLWLNRQLLFVQHVDKLASRKEKPTFTCCSALLVSYLIMQRLHVLLPLFKRPRFNRICNIPLYAWFSFHLWRVVVVVVFCSLSHQAETLPLTPTPHKILKVVSEGFL